MQKSTNYGLNMPDRNDQYNIDHFNQNTEAIDAMLRENSVNTGKNANDISAVAEALEAHGARRDNPHEVTKAQVGLGNVENVSTNNQAPTFTEAESLTNIESGETLSVLFGKVRKLFSTLTGSAATSPVCPFPKGSPYVQYPTFPAPGELYPGTTWEVVDYGGAFFRAEGGNAAAFIAAGEKLKMQGEEIGSHRHNLSNATIKGTTGSMNRNQNHSHIFFANEYGGGGSKYLSFLAGGDSLSLFDNHSWNLDACVASANTDHEHEFSGTISGNTGYYGGSETRPSNYTMRIWRRTA